MTYPELRRHLRERGFINHEIAMVHPQYLCMRAIGVEDSEMLFDHEQEGGILVHKSAMEKCRSDLRVAPDVENHCAYIIHEDGEPTLVGPFT